jgi:hypothetical protein
MILFQLPPINYIPVYFQETPGHLHMEGTEFCPSELFDGESDLISSLKNFLQIDVPMQALHLSRPRKVLPKL